MKINNGLVILARQDPLSKEDWHMLVEIRRSMILESLRQMSLETLGDIIIVRDYFAPRNLKEGQPIVKSEDGLSLDTRGVFPSYSDSSRNVVLNNTEHHRDAGGYTYATTEKFWGLTRNGDWITVEVYLTHSQEPYKYPGRTERVSLVKAVTIRKSSFAEMCAFSKTRPWEIWKRLGQTVKDWVIHRKELLKEAQYLEANILQEEAAHKVLFDR